MVNVLATTYSISFDSINKPNNPLFLQFQKQVKNIKDTFTLHCHCSSERFILACKDFYFFFNDNQLTPPLQFTWLERNIPNTIHYKTDHQTECWWSIIKLTGMLLYHFLYYLFSLKLKINWQSGWDQVFKMISDFLSCLFKICMKYLFFH